MLRIEKLLGLQVDLAVVIEPTRKRRSSVKEVATDVVTKVTNLVRSFSTSQLE